MEEKWGRRAFLGGVGAVTVGLSGCTSQVEDVLGSGDFDHGSADYLTRLPAPEGDGEGYPVFVESPISREDNRPEEYEFSLPDLVAESVSVSEITTRVSFGAVSVLSGSFDPTGIADTLDDVEGLSRVEPKAGYERYESDEGAFAYGIGNPLVLGNSAVSGAGRVMPRVNDTIEAITDSEDAYSQKLPDIATTAGAVGSPTFGIFSPTQTLDLENPESGVFPGQVAEGYARTIRGEQSNVTDILAFESEDAVPVEGLRTWVENNDGEGEQFQHYRDVSYRQEGILGMIDATVPTEEF